MKLNLRRLRRLMTSSDIRVCIGGGGIIAAIAFGMVSPKCTTLCAQIEARAPVINAQLADAQRALSAVETARVRDHLSGDALVDFDEAMARANEGIVLASKAIAMGSIACEDPIPYLQMIVDGWDVIRRFLSLVGGHGVPTIADPIVWVEAKS